MVGLSSAFNAACHLLHRVAPTQATVLFTGESVGSGFGPGVAVLLAVISSSEFEHDVEVHRKHVFTG